MVRLETGVRRSKYGVRLDDAGRAERTRQGVVYASKAEAIYATYLDTLKRGGAIHCWARARSFDLVEPDHAPDAVRHRRSCIKYTPDFRVCLDGRVVWYVEVKGRATADYRLRARLFKHRYPGLRLVIATVNRRGNIEEREA